MAAIIKYRDTSTVSCVKTAELMEMSFGMLCRMDPKNHVLHAVQMPPWEGTILRVKGVPRHDRRHSDVSCAKRAEPTKMSFGLWTRVGTRKHVLDWVQIRM